MKLRKLKTREKRPHIHLWVDPELKRAVLAAAERDRKTLSDWIRDVLEAASRATAES